jgi:Ca2+-binding EF-hand superfamily protein
MVRGLYEKVTKPEIVQIFQQFDKGRKGYVTKSEFLQTFQSEVRETSTATYFNLNIEDIIKPLATKVKKFNVNIPLLFDKYDKNKNQRLSAEELKDALNEDHGIVLHEEEVRTVKEYFVNKYRSQQISKQAFVELLTTKFEKKSDGVEARKCLVDVRNKLEMMKKTPQRFL